MRAAIWFLSFLASIGSELITLYVYMAHEEMEKGFIDPTEVTETFSKCTPWEIYLQFAITFIMLVQGSYIILILSIPLFIYNLKLLSLLPNILRLLSKRYKVYALFRKDYKDYETNKKALMVKSIFNAFFCLITLMKYLRE